MYLRSWEWHVIWQQTSFLRSRLGSSTLSETKITDQLIDKIVHLNSLEGTGRFPHGGPDKMGRFPTCGGPILSNLVRRLVKPLRFPRPRQGHRRVLQQARRANDWPVPHACGVITKPTEDELKIFDADFVNVEQDTLLVLDLFLVSSPPPLWYPELDYASVG